MFLLKLIERVAIKGLAPWTVSAAMFDLRVI